QLRHGHPEQKPERPQKMGKQSPTGPDEKPMVVHKTNQSDPGPGTDQPTGEGPAQPTKRCGNRQRSKPGDDKSHATAPRRRQAMRAPRVGYIQQAARQGVTS